MFNRMKSNLTQLFERCSIEFYRSIASKRSFHMERSLSLMSIYSTFSYLIMIQTCFKWGHNHEPERYQNIVTDLHSEQNRTKIQHSIFVCGSFNCFYQCILQLCNCWCIFQWRKSKLFLSFQFWWQTMNKCECKRLKYTSDFGTFLLFT